ncbi:MAG: 6-bladed beta-propeller [Ginsengibacter sp.]
MHKLLIAFSLLFYSITSIGQPTTIRIDPATATSGTASQLFEEINYIPLETIKESLFGDIQRLTVTDKYFIIQDDASTILLFDKSGKFHAKISDKKLDIQDFKYLKDENKLLVYLVNSKAVTPEMMELISKNLSELLNLFSKLVSARYYDLDGRALSEPVPDSYISIGIASSIELYPGTIASGAFMADKSFPDSTAYQLNIYKKNQLYKSWFPYNTKNDLFRCGVVNDGGIYKTNKDSIFYYTRPFDYTIYTFTEDTILPVFKFILPLQNTVSESLYSDSTSTKEELGAMLKKNPSWITTLENISVFNDLLLFKTVNNEWGFDQSNSFMFNLKSGSLISISKSTPDKENGYLPFLGDNFYYRNFIARDETCLYSNISSLKMFRAKEETAEKNPIYPPVLENYFKTESRMSNPVIVQLKPKENL